jgi:GWxTD domain-containing protein
MTPRCVWPLLGCLVLPALGRAQADSAPPPDQFDSASEGQLDSLYGPLVYIMWQDEAGIYSTLSVDGKRDYLRRFWARRDPTPGTVRNEAEGQYYRRIETANRRFAEGGATLVPGWRTDRGRIFIRNGPPDDVLHRPRPPGALPYEVWKYTHGRSRKYCFVDLTRFGNYVLVYTDDLLEPSRPDWPSLLGPDAYEDVMRF